MLFEGTTEVGKRLEAKQPARPERDRPIYLGSDWWEEIQRLMVEFVGDHMVAMVIDERIGQLYGDKVESWREVLPRVRTLELHAGEGAKTFDTLIEIQRFLLHNEVHRDDIVISMGGGTISDVIGFAAAIFTRGIGWVNIPTTLIAMVDCSIGGKTSINLDSNKNYCGTFYWPNAQMIDLTFTKTLSERQYATAIPEMAKLAMFGQEDLFNKICDACGPSDGAKGLNKDPMGFVEPMIKLKSSMSSADPYQHGIRKLLLTGHVTAHALEGASMLHLHHGEAVSIGLAFESYIAVKRGMMAEETRRKLINLLENCKLPVMLPAELHDSTLVDYMRREKRNRGRSVNFVLPYHIGRALDEWPAPNLQLSIDEIWAELVAYRKECG